jgi:hypothetical protein
MHETKRSPVLVNPENFKSVKIKIDSFKENSKKLNLFLGIGFVLFTIFFLWNCKYGMFKGQQESPEPYSVVYNINSV